MKAILLHDEAIKIEDNVDTTSMVISNFYKSINV